MLTGFDRFGNKIPIAPGYSVDADATNGPHWVLKGQDANGSYTMRVSMAMVPILEERTDAVGTMGSVIPMPVENIPIAPPPPPAPHRHVSRTYEETEGPTQNGSAFPAHPNVGDIIELSPGVLMMFDETRQWSRLPSPIPQAPPPPPVPLEEAQLPELLPLTVNAKEIPQALTGHVAPPTVLNLTNVEPVELPVATVGGNHKRTRRKKA